MSRSRTLRPPLKFLWRHTPKGDEHLFSQVREHCHRGAEVRVQRFGVAPYSIVANGTMWLVRPMEGTPIGTFHCVAAAVIAGDRYMDAWSDGDDFHPGVA